MSEQKAIYFPEKLTIGWLKTKYAEGALTPADVMEEIQCRADVYQDYNVWIVAPKEMGISAYLERLPREVNSLPLWGIPFAIKDNIDLEQVPTTAGCKEYEYMPEENATVVARLMQAGAIPVGKTNLDQFATGLVGTRSPYGEVHNAYHPELISGGSSSGSAVAVALGMAAFSLGTDTAGSGRVPAMLNCLVGYKPAVGAWSSKGVVPACASLDCVTVFANTIEDAELVNREARGFDEECRWSRKLPLNGSKMPKRICLPREAVTFYGSYGERYEKKWRQVIERLETLDVEIQYIDYSIFSKAASILYDGPWVAERWKDLGSFVESHPGATFPVTEKILRSGEREGMTAAAVFEAMHQLAAYKAEAHRMLEDAVLIMPTAGGTFTREEVREDPIATNSKMGLYTNHCNLLDLAAVAVPEDTGDHDVPFGITIFANHDSEDFVLGMAEAFLASETEILAVCGLHKKGFPLEYQLTELGARYLETTHTSSDYRLYRLPTTPEKPGMVKKPGAGDYIEVDLYALPTAKMGRFLRHVSLPLAIGDVTLEDGRCVKGFVCQEYGLVGAEDITSQGTYTIA